MSGSIALGSRNASSYRDPSGHVHLVDGRVFRTVKERARADYEFVRDSGLLKRLQQRGALVNTWEADRTAFTGLDLDVAYVLEHERLPCITFPYEWTFSALRAAAVLHLDVQIEALAAGVVLSDSSAYNIQFLGTRPIFIDVLSFRRYREGEFWAGHRQFCEQFLNPLLLVSRLGVRHNAWYRGNGEGIETAELSRLLHWRDKLSWKVFSNITLQARMQHRSLDAATAQLSALKARKLPRHSYEGILRSLLEWIASLAPRETGKTVWQNYSRDNTYSSEETQLKHRVIQAFAEKTRPGFAWDLGCNTGEYSDSLLRGGAGYVLGIDYDHGALENAYARSRHGGLNLQPIFQDAANCSPNQGWRGRERRSLEDRGRPEAIVALAFEHHLAIGRNIPLPDVVDWLVSLAPRGIIEFVQKDDETVRKMLAVREDIFQDYHQQAFEAAMEQRARIVERTTVSAGGRTLYEFERR